MVHFKRQKNGRIIDPAKHLLVKTAVSSSFGAGVPKG
jgi:hypothetical protein